MNECQTDNGGCVHICTNTIGRFECSCEDGFQFATLPEDSIPDPTNAGRACIGMTRISEHSGNSLLRTFLGPHEVSVLRRCPYFRGCLVHFSM